MTQESPSLKPCFGFSFPINRFQEKYCRYVWPLQHARALQSNELNLNPRHADQALSTWKQDCCVIWQPPGNTNSTSQNERWLCHLEKVIQIWGFPARHGGTPLSLHGFCERENPIYKWMMTRGTPMAPELRPSRGMPESASSTHQLPRFPRPWEPWLRNKKKLAWEM